MINKVIMNISCLIIVLGSTFVANASAFCVTIQKPVIDSIVIFRTDDQIDMSISICCEEILGLFDIKKELITNGDSISAIADILSSSINIDLDWKCVDTRAVVYIYYSNGIMDRLCIGTTTIVFYKEKIMELKNRRLFDYIFKH